jgi:hypothetical protein
MPQPYALLFDHYDRCVSSPDRGPPSQSLRWLDHPTTSSIAARVFPDTHIRLLCTLCHSPLYKLLTVSPVGICLLTVIRLCQIGASCPIGLNNSFLIDRKFKNNFYSVQGANSSYISKLYMMIIIIYTTNLPPAAQDLETVTWNL